MNTVITTVNVKQDNVSELYYATHLLYIKRCLGLVSPEDRYCLYCNTINSRLYGLQGDCGKFIHRHLSTYMVYIK